MDRIRICDLETTGLNPADGAGVCEVGATDLNLVDGAWLIGSPTSSYVNPGHKIPPDMSAVHHIIDSDVANAPSWLEAQNSILLNGLPPVYAAHKASFERTFFDAPNAKWICTWKCAVTLAPNAPGWSNQTLRYWLKLAVDREISQPAHRAGPDAYVTAHLLKRMLAKATVDQLVEISAKPVVLPKLTFGMHAMKPCAEVPLSYWTYVLKQDFDEDVKHTAFHYLNQSRQT